MAINLKWIIISHSPGNLDFRLIVALLELNAHLLEQAAAVFPGVEGEDRNIPAVRPFRSQDALNGCAFPGSVGPQQSKGRTAFDRQAHMVYRRERPIRLGQTFDFYNFVHIDTSFFRWYKNTTRENSGGKMEGFKNFSSFLAAYSAFLLRFSPQKKGRQSACHRQK